MQKLLAYWGGKVPAGSNARWMGMRELSFPYAAWKDGISEEKFFSVLYRPFVQGCARPQKRRTLSPLRYLYYLLS